jgi:hypothetical protein
MEDVGIFYGHLYYYFVAIFWLFCIFCCLLVYFKVIWCIFPVLVCCTNKNLATLLTTQQRFCVANFFATSSWKSRGWEIRSKNVFMHFPRQYIALAAWCSGHRLRAKNIRSWVSNLGRV